jgi:hypothetical protein
MDHTKSRDRALVRHSKIELRMSQMGQKRTLTRVQPMSALPPKADIVQHGGNVRFVPIPDKVKSQRQKSRDRFRVQLIETSVHVGQFPSHPSRSTSETLITHFAKLHVE